MFATLGEAFREKQAENSASSPLDNAGKTLNLINVQDYPVHDNLQLKPSSPTHPHFASGNEDIRGGFSTQSPSNSPRPTYRVPARRTSGYQTWADPLAASPRGRPVSMPPNLYPLSSPSGFNLNQLRGISGDPRMGPSRSTSRKSTKYGFYSLDSLSIAGDPTTSSAENVLLTGSDNSLHVFKIDADKIVQIGKLEGLRGSVVSAKIVPSSFRVDPVRQSRPLVVMVLHGPFVSETGSSRPGSSGSNHSLIDPSCSFGVQGPGIQTWQTTVEVFSLKDQKRVSILYASELCDVEATGMYGQQTHEPPKPIGALTIHVNSQFIIVSSGQSGEIFIFQTTLDGTEQRLCYIGKTWTSTFQHKSRTWSSSSASPEVEQNRDKSPSRSLQQQPALLSLSHRWLAYVPPVASSRSTIFGRVMVPTSIKGPPGGKSHTASSQPQANCQLDTPLEESKINKVARGVTQDFLKGAKWVGDQGVQAFKNYWSKSPETTSPHEQNVQLPVAPQFPPTHAPDDPNRPSQQPTVISLLDLQHLAKSQDAKPDLALRPATTFALDGGCSFLSFSPSGLNLFTASSKGDVQYVWDLMQATHLRATLNTAPSSKSINSQPLVRQIARHIRVTVANIVDVIWRGPTGEKFAVITDRGTVHLHDLPPSTRQWPPLAVVRRSRISVNRDSEPIAPTSISSGWNSAFNTKPLFSAVRANPLMGFGNLNLAQASAGASAKGGKIVAAGFSKSVEGMAGTVKAVRNWGETRLHIPGASEMLAPGCVRWLGGRDKEAVIVVGKDTIQVHRVALQSDGKGKGKYSAFRGRLGDDLTVPSPVDKVKDSDGKLDGVSATRGYWPESAAQHRTSASYASRNPLSHAEIDSSSPYQPFHADSRVNLFNYASNSYGVGGSWVFGEDIATNLLMSGVDGAALEHATEHEQVSEQEEDDFAWGEPATKAQREAREIVEGAFSHEYSDE